MGLLSNKYFLASIAVAYFAKDLVHKQLEQEDGWFGFKYKASYMLIAELLGLGTTIYILARTLKIAKR